jgi:hypothetical protein
MKSYFLIIIFVLLFCLVPIKLLAANSLDVAINEIAWMGTASSANDEWIELYNNTKNNLNLEGWILKSEDGSPEIKLTGVITASGFYLLERTDDNTIPEIAADLIYKGALNNSGENLKLYDNLNNIIDEVDCGGGWFAGIGKLEYKTMERINSLISGNQSSNWQTSQAPAGTPRAENSKQGTADKEQKTKNEPQSKKLTEDGPLQNYPNGVIFSELLPSPEGPDEKEEWIELFNQNSFEVDLSGWKIEDVSGKITAFTFPKETKISSQEFLVFSRPTTKISLNNDGDGLVLLLPDGKTIDSVNYSKAPRGQSYNRSKSDWFWSANLTPGAANIAEKTETRHLQDASASETREKRELASVGKQIAKSSKFLFVLLIALGLAIFSGITILILKKKLKKSRPI